VLVPNVPTDRPTNPGGEKWGRILHPGKPGLFIATLACGSAGPGPGDASAQAGRSVREEQSCDGAARAGASEGVEGKQARRISVV